MFEADLPAAPPCPLLERPPTHRTVVRRFAGDVAAKNARTSGPPAAARTMTLLAINSARHCDVLRQSAHDDALRLSSL